MTASCVARPRWFASAVFTASAFVRSLPMPTALAGPFSATSPAGNQLITEALNLAGAEVLDATESGLVEAATLADAIEAIFAPWREVLLKSNFTMGCPLAATVIDAAGDDRLRQEARALFDQWRDSVHATLVKFGVQESTAKDNASVLLAALEGALILSRASQSTQPLDTVQRFFTRSLTQTAANPALSARMNESSPLRVPESPALSPSQLAKIGERGEERSADVGDVLFQVGDDRYPFVAILEGEVAMLDGAGNEIVRQGRSNFLGELNLLSGQSAFLTAEVTPALALHRRRQGRAAGAVVRRRAAQRAVARDVHRAAGGAAAGGGAWT